MISERVRQLIDRAEVLGDLVKMYRMVDSTDGEAERMESQIVALFDDLTPAERDEARDEMRRRSAPAVFTEVKCCICDTGGADLVETNCKHIFHRACVTGSRVCPVCLASLL